MPQTNKTNNFKLYPHGYSFFQPKIHILRLIISPCHIFEIVLSWKSAKQDLRKDDIPYPSQKYCLSRPNRRILQRIISVYGRQISKKTLICFRGSDGGIKLPKMLSEVFRSHGLTTLALAYVAEEWLPQHFSNIPLDFLEKAAAQQIMKRLQEHNSPTFLNIWAVITAVICLCRCIL